MGNTCSHAPNCSSKHGRVVAAAHCMAGDSGPQNSSQTLLVNTASPTPNPSTTTHHQSAQATHTYHRTSNKYNSNTASSKQKQQTHAKQAPACHEPPTRASSPVPGARSRGATTSSSTTRITSDASPPPFSPPSRLHASAWGWRYVNAAHVNEVVTNVYGVVPPPGCGGSNKWWCDTRRVHGAQFGSTGAGAGACAMPSVAVVDADQVVNPQISSNCICCWL